MNIILETSPSRYGVLQDAGKRARGLVARIFAATFTALALFSVASAPAGAETLRITALGDSLTQGYGLLPEEGLVPQLQAWLTARGHDVAIQNAGVSGDTTAGGLSRLDWTLADAPDAMIVALGGNDLLRGIDPALSRSNLAGILERLTADGIPALLVGLPAPGNYGATFQAEFDAMYPDLAAQFGTLLLRDLLAPVTAATDAGTPMTDLMQRDMIHPNPAGVALVVEQLGPAVEALIARTRAAEGS